VQVREEASDLHATFEKNKRASTKSRMDVCFGKGQESNNSHVCVRIPEEREFLG